jgi:hypothetical protein
MLSISILAQNNVIKFLGIPVDGTKSAMIQKLKEKGYTYNSSYDKLEGEFNGRQVLISVLTYNNKVWRIAVLDAHPSSETQIKIRFNTLCRQFEQNKKYMSMRDNQEINESEDISYEMSIHNKQYEASFYQLGEKLSPVEFYSKSDEELDQLSKNITWFTISQMEYDSYIIMLFYDNMNNQANGEDL